MGTRLISFLFATLLCVCALPLLAQETPSLTMPQRIKLAIPAANTKPTADIPTSGTHALTRMDLEPWLDGFLPYALQRGDVAGAVVVVVKDGKILLQKGYGYADVAAHKPVDPARTLFRPGSVSKLFTWTAVMQLVEQGKLDLDADINTYLDFKIPPYEGKPVTLRNLMTHTAGFDEAQRALITSDPHNMTSLEQALKRWVPPRVTAAGSTPAYSNYGAALAGYIVQRISGEAFADYVEHHSLAPLGMTHSSFHQPLPASLQPLLSKAYKLGSGEPQPYEMISLSPAGALSASGADMGRFMIAHLQNGAFGSSRILQEDTAVKMHGTATTMIPPLDRMLLGFYENNVNGHRVVTHAGDTQWFHSELNLFVDDGVGVYISVNSLGKEGAAAPIRGTLFKEFADRYFPGPLPAGKVDANTARQHAQLLAGRYLFSRRSHSTFFAALNLLGQIKVSLNADGTLLIPALKNLAGQPRKWAEIAPFVWRNVDGGDRLAAKVVNGHVERFGYDAFPFMQFEPVPWWASSGWLLPLWLASLAALMLTVLAWPVSALVRRHYGVAYGLSGREGRAHRLVRIAALLVLATMVAVVALFGLMSSNFDWAGARTDGWVVILRVLSLPVFVGGAAIAAWNAWLVLRSARRRMAKLWSVVLAVSCLTILYVGIVFHIIGFSANY